MTEEGRGGDAEPEGTPVSGPGSGDGFRSPSHREPPWERSDSGRWTAAGAEETTVDAFTAVGRPIERPPGRDDGARGDSHDGPGGHRAPGRPRATVGARRRKRGAHRATRLARGRNILVEFVALVAIALTLTLVIKTYVVQAFYIPSGSMQNTLAIGDRVLVNKMVYDFRGIHRGDIVVFDGAGTWDPGAPQAPQNLFVRFWDDLAGVFGVGQTDIYIKRVIGLPGDRVACCTTSGQITVNGVPLDESSYLYPGNQSGSGDVRPYSIVVPPGSLWVLGDHRAISFDSRGHMGDPGGGAIPEKAVLGRAFVIIWPPSQWTILNIPATFEQPKLSASAGPPGSSEATIAALDRGVTVRQAATPLPLVLGFAGAVPLTWLQRKVRRRVAGRLPRRRTAAGPGEGPFGTGKRGRAAGGRVNSVTSRPSPSPRADRAQG
jgi:signal peptidase I